MVAITDDDDQKKRLTWDKHDPCKITGARVCNWHFNLKAHFFLIG